SIWPPYRSRPLLDDLSRLYRHSGALRRRCHDRPEPSGCNQRNVATQPAQRRVPQRTHRTLAPQGSSQIGGARVMTLAFPNPSRSFDEVRNAVLFMGHDGMFQIRFFIEAGALTRSDAAKRQAGTLEAKCLSAFDALRTSIYE